MLNESEEDISMVDDEGEETVTYDTFNFQPIVQDLLNNNVPSSTADTRNQNQFLSLYTYLNIILITISIIFVSSLIFGMGDNQMNDKQMDEKYTYMSPKNTRQIMEGWKRGNNLSIVQDEEVLKQNQPLPNIVSETNSDKLLLLNDFYKPEDATAADNIFTTSAGMGNDDKQSKVYPLLFTVNTTMLNYLWMDTFLDASPTIQQFVTYSYFVRMIAECIFVIGIVLKCSKWAYLNFAAANTRSTMINIQYKDRALSFRTVVTATVLQQKGCRRRHNPKNIVINTNTSHCYHNLPLDVLIDIKKKEKILHNPATRKTRHI